MDSELYLSVVIPAYNEEQRLQKSLGQVVSFLNNQSWTSEVIIVDDGSQDRTIEVARNALQNIRHKVIESRINRGKGNAVRQGVLSSEGKYVLFTDADLSTPIEEVLEFLKLLNEKYDIVIGSRGLSNSKVQVRQNILRQTMGKVFNVFAQFFSFRDIRDSQCGFKCFKANAARTLFSLQQIDGFSFDAEVLYLAQRLGFKIYEAPVVWINSPQSKVSILSDPIKMFVELFLIRWRHRNLNPETVARHQQLKG